MKSPFQGPAPWKGDFFRKCSQFLHKIIGTHLLTVLTIRVILHAEHREQVTQKNLRIRSMFLKRKK